jgi:lipoprotein-anchoring transpeptidase ErfK/SrfK
MMDSTRKFGIGFVAAAALIATVPSLHAQDRVQLTIPGQPNLQLFKGERSADLLLVQTLLDRSHHSPGVIDGMMGGNTRRAIRAFEAANGMPVDGRIDAQLIRALVDRHGGNVLQRYTITEDDVNGPFNQIPSSMEAQAKLDKLSYKDPVELLAEKFHMSRSFLQALNPGADFGKAGTQITVVVAGDETLKPEVARVEINKARSEVRALDGAGKLVATYPATVGSSEFPSPGGSMEVRAIAPEPTYHFDPSGRSWGPDEAVNIAAGPNNPVGSTWIDLSKDGYGIHGTPEPRLIGKTASHGCVRLTNWDAEELAKAVSQGTKVVFI